MKTFIKKIVSFSAIVVVLTATILPSLVNAQNNDQQYNQDVPITSDPGLKLVLSQPLEQDYKTRTFKLSLEIDSLIDSNRIGVEWRFPQQLLDIAVPEKDVVSVVKGQKTLITKEFTPKAVLPVSVVNRKVEIAVIVNGFVAGESYLSSEKINVTFTPDMVIQPELKNYANEKRSTTMRNIFVVITSIVVFGLAIFFVVRQVRAYLNTNDVT
jgi:hypothetical protein